MAGNAAGKETDTIHADGSADVEYSYNDRGRGPELES